MPWIHLPLWFVNIPDTNWVCFSGADEPLPFYEVLVGVLSARHHYQLRQAIRETWLGYLRDHPHFHQRSVCRSLQLGCLLSSPVFLLGSKAGALRWNHSLQLRTTTTPPPQKKADSLINTFIFTWPPANIVPAFHSSSWPVFFFLFFVTRRSERR